MELDASLDWLSLSMTPGLGSRLTGKLAAPIRFACRKCFVLRSPSSKLASLPSASGAGHSSQAARTRMPKQELARVRKLGCRLVNWGEPEYPQRLLEIYDPPPLLYVRGDAGALNRHSISMVGTRRPTPYGNQIGGTAGA